MISIEVDGLEGLQQRLHRLGQAGVALPALLNAIGAEVESQTRRRITDEKAGPDGSAWEAWSDDYGKTRHGGQSLLEGHGDLVDSIGFEIDADGVHVGTNLVYGAIHQFGGEAVGKNIPARPFLGLSAENENDLLAILDQWANDLANQ